MSSREKLLGLGESSFFEEAQQFSWECWGLAVAEVCCGQRQVSKPPTRRSWWMTLPVNNLREPQRATHCSTSANDQHCVESVGHPFHFPGDKPSHLLYCCVAFVVEESWQQPVSQVYSGGRKYVRFSRRTSRLLCRITCDDTAGVTFLSMVDGCIDGYRHYDDSYLSSQKYTNCQGYTQ